MPAFACGPKTENGLIFSIRTWSSSSSSTAVGAVVRRRQPPRACACVRKRFGFSAHSLLIPAHLDYLCHMKKKERCTPVYCFISCLCIGDAPSSTLFFFLHICGQYPRFLYFPLVFSTRRRPVSQAKPPHGITATDKRTGAFSGNFVTSRTAPFRRLTPTPCTASGHVANRFGTVALTESERAGLWTVCSDRADLLLTIVKELVKVTGVR